MTEVVFVNMFVYKSIHCFLGESCIVEKKKNMIAELFEEIIMKSRNYSLKGRNVETEIVLSVNLK